MAGTNVGGVSVSVSLSVKDALKELEKLDKQMKKTFGGVTGGSQGKVTQNVDNGNKSLLKTVVVANAASKAMTSLGKSTEGVKNQMGTLGQAAILSRRNPLAALGKAASALGQGLKSIGAGGIAAGLTIGAVLTAAIAATIAVAGLVAVVSKLGAMGISAGKELEKLNISMTSILGSAERATQEIRTLQAIAIDSPFLTTSIINLDKFLLSQGVASGELRQGLVTAVLDLSSALGLADDNLGSITYALAQVQARGYLSGDEMRQLANQFIPVIESLRSLPEYASLSNAAIRKLIEDGQISSTTFFNALIESTEKYQGAAQAMAVTVDGLLNKMEDLTRIAVGQAFLDVDQMEGAISPLTEYRNILSNIVGILDQIDWRPFAAALGQLTHAFTGPITDFLGGSGNILVTFFNVWLPNAILFTAKMFMYLGAILGAFWKLLKTFGGLFADLWNALVDVLISFGLSWQTIFQALAIIAGIAVVAVVSTFQSFIGVLTLVAGAVAFVIGLIRVLLSVMVGDFAAAGKGWNSMVTGVQNAVRGFGTAMSSVPSTVNAAVGAITDLGNAFRKIAAIKLPDFADLGGLTDFVDNFSNAPGGEAADGGGGGGGGGAAKTVDEIAKIMDMLWDLTRQWRGLRSELETGLLGKNGFTATIDDVLAMSQKLDEAFISLGRSDVGNWIYAQTQSLIDLVGQRNELTEQLTEATRNYARLVDERDKFAADIRDSAIKFAAALKVETESIKTFEYVSDRGFFIESEQTKQKDLVASLRERAEALKNFYDNIKKLKDAGLDSALLEDLLAAGPDQSGEAAAALVQGGQEMVDSVNIIYGDIAETADLLAEFGATEFHDAGVAQAEALVNGLTSDLAAIEAEAIALVDTIYAVVEPFAQEMEDVGAAGSAGLAGGLAGGLPAVNSAMGALGGGISGGLAGMDDAMTRGGSKMTDTFAGTLATWVTDLEESTAEMVLQIESIVGTINSWLEEIKVPNFDLSKMFTGSWSAIYSSVVDFMNNLRRALYQKLKNIPQVVRIFIPGMEAAYRWAAGASASGSGGGTRTYGVDSSSVNTSGSAFLSGQAFAAGNLAATQVSTDASGSGGGSASGDYFGGDLNNEQPTPIVKVYIGDEELRGIVRTEVVYSDTIETRRVLSGRRG